MSYDGRFLAGAAWGNKAQTSPTISVWKTSSAVPEFTYITPGVKEGGYRRVKRAILTLDIVGSMVDIDVKSVGGIGYVVSGGKHVHNNDFGDGGDLYAVGIQ